jgi:predicted nucleic acid-binding protein
VVLYLLSEDHSRADRAEALIAGGGIASVQVLNETASVARKKLKLTWPEVEELLGVLRACCEIIPVSVEIHELGLRLAQDHRLEIHDAMICAAAAFAGADTLWTEDLNHGQLVAGVRIANPFA